MKAVHVDLGEDSYKIAVGAGARERLPEILREVVAPTRVAIVSDEIVGRLYGQEVLALTAGEWPVFLTLVRPGEPSKCLRTVEELTGRLVDFGLDRRSVIVALGGGVVGDLAGLVAGLYMRGVACVQMPTTLLADVDSSVGGKVAVDHEKGKNLIGLFRQPRAVLIDTDFLNSLDERQFACGMAEVVKYGVIQDGEFFNYLEVQVEKLRERDGEVLERVVGRCVRLKADVVEEDPREEKGLRAILNFGHTFAHALETAGRYESLMHGEAVALGMIAASWAASEMGIFTRQDAERVETLLRAFSLPSVVDGVRADDAMAAMRSDKKALAGKLRFVLPTQLGTVQVMDDVDEALVRRALEKIGCG